LAKKTRFPLSEVAQNDRGNREDVYTARSRLRDESVADDLCGLRFCNLSTP
jgi:hypothetical protein